MAGIRSTNTHPEMTLRKALHSRGLRYRLIDKRLPGRPDLVFPKYHAVLFVHGCFWHKHDCHMFKWPSTRREFWREKLSRNSERDAIVVAKLVEAGWRVGIVWECALKGKWRRPLDDVAEDCAKWLKSKCAYLEIRGNIR
ncbi:very short patch repair endonuclease [Parvibaculum sp.]|uniref:very short patch repair endonuclease n=1 Tax=Parvibaculum sp. TaxID=2024848 RepID=UPI0039191813